MSASTLPPASAPHPRPVGAPLSPADIGLLDYWNALYRQRWLIIGITGAVVLLALLVLLLMTPKYRATSVLQIERESLNVANVANLMPVESPQDRDFYQTQYELLGSRSLARQVIREAKLTEAPAFKPLVDEALEKLQDNGDGRAPTPQARAAAAENALVGPVLDALTIEPVRDSRLVRINFDSPDRVLATRVANTYAKMFIASTQERRLQASSFAARYLSERLAQLRDKVEESEKNAVDYSSQEQIVSMGDDKPSLPTQNMSELNVRLAAAQDARIKAEAAWRQAGIGDGMGLPQVVSNPLIQNLRAEQAKMTADYQQKLATFQPGYPEMQRLQNQIAETKRQIADEVANIRSALKNDYESARQQETLLADRIAALKNDELDLQTRSIRYTMLRREADTNRQLYDALLQRYKEIGVVGNVGTNNISIVDRADVPGKPSSPKKLLGLALAFVFGLFLAVAVALVRYFIREAEAAAAASA
ncbi:GumC family protein [Xanthomonas sacchari]|uniref:GumC family protein n=1 Tax=Xanthomonas sacchari TaxID=56458 RepID=UPI0024351399|nr:GumC family protein [Xanthomonas sacchari]